MSRYKNRTLKRKKIKSRSQYGFWLYLHVMPSGHYYYGLTARSVEERKEEHFEAAREGSTTKFHTQLRENNFQVKTKKWKFEDERGMAKAEIDAINAHKDDELLCNRTKGGEVAKGLYYYDKRGALRFRPKKKNAGVPWIEPWNKGKVGSMSGRKRSKETKERLSESKLGNKNPMKDHDFSDEHREKLSNSAKGMKWYTDGVKNTKARECPDGWYAGRTHKGNLGGNRYG